MARSVARQRRNDAAALPEWIAPQLTQLVEAAPKDDQWLHEIKYDGYRMTARLDRGAVKLLTRTGLDSHGGSQVKRIRSSVLRVSDPKSEPFVIRARLPGHRIKLTYGRRSITVVPTSRLRRAEGSRGRDQSGRRLFRPCRATVAHLDLPGLINPGRLQNTAEV